MSSSLTGGTDARAVLALALVLPGWLAALIVALVLLGVAGGVALAWWRRR